MSDSNKAVFLSYASQDAEAAKRICEALRAAGIEVWFDQSELRGGDAWDQKIRKQIKECTLFVPIVSANTQARLEGYFRLEWKLAEDRSHLMAKGKPFIVPVTIDSTTERDAQVPDSFLAVQWTGLSSPDAANRFARRVQEMLSGTPAGGPRSPEAAKTVPAFKNSASRDLGPPVGRHKAVWIGAAAVVALVGAGFIAFRPESNPTPANSELRTPNSEPRVLASAKSLAVLPFENLSPDAANEFFADGMHDEVITSLVKIRDLTVISRASVLAYRKTEGRNRQAIAAELGVANLLEGRVRRAGSQVKVTVELIEASSGQVLWAQPYTKDLTDVFAIQAELATAITSALQATLSPEEKTLIARRPTENQEAYDLYLRARALGDTQGDVRSRETTERVITLYEQAIARDPSFAQAHVQLCFAHGILYWFGYLDPTPARRVRAKAALDAAIQLAPAAPETRFASGLYAYTCENDWNSALAEFRAAAIGLPNDAQVIGYIGFALRRLGRMAESVDYIARSVELNPREVSTPGNHVGTLLALRRYDAVTALETRYRSLYSTDTTVLENLAKVQFGRDGDRATYLRHLEAAPPDAADLHGLFKAYRIAMARGDLAAADRALADPRLTFVRGSGAVIDQPVLVYRALVAFLRGDPATARKFADEAIDAYSRVAHSPRQLPWAMVGTAMAHALAGRVDEAVKLGREGMTLQNARDQFDAAKLRPELGAIYIICGRPDEALDVLREMMTGPCEESPADIRHDPLWSRLKSDPRFEEILKSAKPL